jgi:hypothetical protein
MKKGTPSKASGRVTVVHFELHTDSFEEEIKDWLSDNPGYHEVSRNTAWRCAIFKSGRVDAVPKAAFSSRGEF